MSDMNDKILKAINEALPQAVAGELKTYIQQAQTNEKLLKNSQQEVYELRKENTELKDKDRSNYDLTKREAAATLKEAEQRLKEDLLKLREAHAKERVDEIRNLTSTVFQSNRLGYNVNLSVPNPTYGKPNPYGQTDYDQSRQVTGDLEQRG